MTKLAEIGHWTHILKYSIWAHSFLIHPCLFYTAIHFMTARGVQNILQATHRGGWGLGAGRRRETNPLGMIAWEQSVWLIPATWSSGVRPMSDYSDVKKRVSFQLSWHLETFQHSWLHNKPCRYSAYQTCSVYIYIEKQKRLANQVEVAVKDTDSWPIQMAD